MEEIKKTKQLTTSEDGEREGASRASREIEGEKRRDDVSALLIYTLSR